MGQVLFAAIALMTIAFGIVNRRAFLLTVVVLAGVPISLMTGDTEYFAALGGMAGVAAWLFAIVIGSLAALIAHLGKLHQVLARTPLFLCFLLFAAASLSWGHQLLDGARMLAKLAAPILFFWVIVAMSPGVRLMRRFETALYASCVLAAALAFVNTLGGGVLAPLPLKGGILGLPALATPYSSPANFSFFMACGAIVAYCRFLESRRVVHAVLAALCFVCVTLAFVRVTLLGALLGVCIVHLVRARAAATPLFIGIAVLAGVLIVTSDAFMHRMFFVPERVKWSEAVTAPDKFMAGINTSGRTLLWARAAHAFAEESPWVGAGVGAVDAWIKTGDSFSSELHSEVYRVKIELGWIGLAIFILGLASLWWQLVRAMRRGGRDAADVPLRASCALIPVYFVTLLTDNTLNYAAGFGVLVYGFAALALVEMARRAAAPVPARERATDDYLQAVAAQSSTGPITF